MKVGALNYILHQLRTRRCCNELIVGLPHSLLIHTNINVDSHRHMITATCNPVTLVDNAAFRKFVNTLEPKFVMPTSAKLNSLLNEEVLTIKHRDLISEGRRFTICLDGWAKNGLTVSFLGISISFFHSKSEKPIHALFNLYLVKHPHSGEQISDCLEKCLKHWNISGDKILLAISDNEANVFKGIKLLGMRTQAERDILSKLENEVSE